MRLLSLLLSVTIILGQGPFLAQFARGEYRAFQLRIVNTQTQAERMVTSTLDHIQYRGYYSLQKNEEIFYHTSWMCRGNTSQFKRTCPNPRLLSAGARTSP